MELWLFLGAVFVVLVLLMWRSRSGGTRARPVDEYHHIEGEPINYGAIVSPRGTSQAAEVDAPWFGREHPDTDHRSSGPDE